MQHCLQDADDDAADAAAGYAMAPAFAAECQAAGWWVVAASVGGAWFVAVGIPAAAAVAAETAAAVVAAAGTVVAAGLVVADAHFVAAA